MIAYIDSSVLVRQVLGEPERLALWPNITRGISSELLRVECLRAIDRWRLRDAIPVELLSRARETALQLILAIEQLPLTHSIMERAAQPMPTRLGTLDALHLATALHWRQSTELPIVLATHDIELGYAAHAHGMQVIGVDFSR